MSSSWWTESVPETSTRQGLLYGLLTGDVERGVRYGNARGAIEQASWEDFNYATLAEVEAQLKGAGSRIFR